jgi:predicted Zn-dependent protease
VRLRIIPLGAVDPDVLTALSEGLPGYLPVRPELVPRGPDLPDEPQYSGDVVDRLLEDQHESDWRLGVTERLLLADDGSIVFGEATVAGPAAVISLAPLREGPLWRLRERTLVSALHELGHLLGLEHCESRRCVMYPSREVGDTDAKGPMPCAACTEWIQEFFAGRA